MSDYQMFEAIVRDVEQITAQVKRFTLVSPTGAPLPGFSGGSHIIVQMQDGEHRYSNAYSHSCIRARSFCNNNPI